MSNLQKLELQAAEHVACIAKIRAEAEGASICGTSAGVEVRVFGDRAFATECTTKAPELPEVAQRLHGLHLTIGTLEEVTFHLAERLNPVRGGDDSADQKCAGASPEPSRSPVASDIYAAECRIRGLIAKLHEINRTLEV